MSMIIIIIISGIAAAISYVATCTLCEIITIQCWILFSGACVHDGGTKVIHISTLFPTAYICTEMVLSNVKEGDAFFHLFSRRTDGRSAASY